MNYAANASLLIRLICHSNSVGDCNHEDTLIKCLTAVDEFQIQPQSQSFWTIPRVVVAHRRSCFVFWQNILHMRVFWLYPDDWTPVLGDLSFSFS